MPSLTHAALFPSSEPGLIGPDPSESVGLETREEDATHRPPTSRYGCRDVGDVCDDKEIHPKQLCYAFSPNRPDGRDFTGI